ncbi:MAG: NAD-dependent epimerase/dehydratase family protein [Chloroflexota bacterium]
MAVVTGGAGFIGSHIVDRLQEEGWRVWVFDDLSTGSPTNLTDAAEFEQGDLADRTYASRIARVRPAVVVHCAAQTSVTRSIQDPAADARSNILGSLNVIEAALEAPSTTLIYVTTGGALFGTGALSHAEDQPVSPQSPYGWSKWIVERYLDVLGAGRLRAMIMRLSNVYGPRQRADGEGGVVSIFADRMFQGLPVTIDGDGEQTRDFIYVGDVTEAVLKAMAANAPATVNVSTGRATSINRLFQCLATISGYERPPTYGPARPGDIRDSRLDPRRAEAVLGWAAATRFEDGLTSTYSSIGKSTRGPRA